MKTYYLNFSKGVEGERIAVDFLKKNKFDILTTNYHSYIDEIDIIALKNNIYHIIEVKRRINLDFGYPREAVTKIKQQKIKRTAEFYFLVKKIVEPIVEFDIIEIVESNVTFIKNAF